MDKTIDTFLNDLDLRAPEQVAILERVRGIYKQLHPTISEKVIYGGIGFFLNEQHIGGVYPYKEYASVVFSRGNELKDHDSLLKGNGKFRRHLKLYDLDDIEAKNVNFFVKQNLALG